METMNGSIFMMQSKVINERQYVCIRPERKLRKLDAELFSPGFENSLSVVFEINNPHVLWLNDLLWFSDFPAPEGFIKRIIENPFWFVSKIEDRVRAYNLIKHNINTIQNEIRDVEHKDTKKLLEIMERLELTLKDFLTYVYLSFPDELAIRQLQDILLTKMDQKKASNYIFSVLSTPTYTKNMLSKGLIFSEKKTLKIPPVDPLVFIDGEIEIKAVKDEEWVLEKFMNINTPLEFANSIKFHILRIATPLLHQMSEENHYIGKAIIVSLEYTLFHIAEVLIEKNILTATDEILDMSLISIYQAVQ